LENKSRRGPYGKRRVVANYRNPGDYDGFKKKEGVIVSVVPNINCAFIKIDEYGKDVFVFLTSLEYKNGLPVFKDGIQQLVGSRVICVPFNSEKGPRTNKAILLT